MFNQPSDMDKKYRVYLDILKDINSELFPGYDLKHILYVYAWYSMEVNKNAVALEVIKSFLTNPKLEIRVSENDVLTLFTKTYRTDHDTYWQGLIDDLGEHDAITILNHTKHKYEKIRLSGFFSKLRWYRIAKKELNEIVERKVRNYLAAQMVRRKWVFEKIKKLNLRPKAVMCFCDALDDEALLMPYFKKQGAITVTNQHGQPTFYSKEYDFIQQSQLLNYCCDYFLARGEFTRNQFEKAGLDTTGLRTIGIVGKNYDKIGHSDTGVIGVYLDTPLFNFADYSNSRLIGVAKELAKRIGLKYFIKLHPADSADKYDAIIDENCTEIYSGKAVSLLESFKKIEFAIVHATSTYVDVYGAGLRCFKLNTEVYFPNACEEDCFSTVDEILDKVKIWNSQSDEEKECYILKVRKRYDSGWQEGNIRKIFDEIL
jgi:hypothetical protein